MKTVFECTDCGYGYHSPWYEPLWLAKRVFVPDHAEVHEMYFTAPESLPLIASWQRLERERIVKLLEDNHLTAASELIEQNALEGENK
jgi:hypothetical protein